MRIRLAGIALIVFFTSTVGQQQFQPGVYSMSGTLSYTSDREEALHGFRMSRTAFLLSPDISYFVVEGVEITFGPTYSRIDYEYTNLGDPTMEGSTTSLGIALGLRNYLIRSSVAPFVGAGGRVSWSKQKSFFYDLEYSRPVWTYFAEAGVSFAVTNHFGIEPTIQYIGGKDDQITTSGIMAAVRFKYFVFE